MEQNYTINFIKFAAMFFIVSIHSGTMEGINVFGLNGDNIDKVIEVFGRFAVPFFFLASGFLFTMQIDAKRESLPYLIKNVKKLTLLYASWFLIYAVYDYWKILWETGNYALLGNEEALSYLETLYTREVFIYGVSHTQYHLWFLPALIWPILFIYLFYKLNLIDILLIFSFLLHLYGMLGQSYSFLMEVPYTTRDPFFFGMFYASAGSFIAVHYQRIKKIASNIHDQLFIVALPALLLIQLGERTITNEYFDGGGEEYFLTTIPLSLLVFFLALKYRHFGKGTWYNKVGRNAVGIFVIHPLIISITNVILTEMNRQEWKDHLLYGFLFTPAVFLLSYFLYLLIQNGKAQILSLFKTA